jgi:hypothetical protein
LSNPNLFQDLNSLLKLIIKKQTIDKLNRKRKGLVYDNRLPAIYSLVILPGLSNSAASVCHSLES